MDAFTRRHLLAWVDRNVYPEDHDAFMEYATTAVNDDPDYDWNWPSLYRSFRVSL